MGVSGSVVKLCGSLEVGGGRPQLGAQARLLLAYLVLHRDQPVTREELIDAIWGERLPSNPRAALRSQLSRLRRALPELIELEGDEVRLALPGNALVDVEAARAAADRAASAVRAGAWRDAHAAAAAVVANIEHELLPDTDARWLEEKRRELSELRVHALEIQARAAIELGDLLGARRLAQLATTDDPYRESACAVLMRALAAEGNVAEALRAYDILRVRLRELGVAPGPELQEVHRGLLAVTGEPAVPSNLRHPATRLIGRDVELEELSEIAAQDSVRLITLVGPGGVGKTRLALELAHMLQRDYADGALFVGLERIVDPALVRAEVAATLAARDGDEQVSADGLERRLRGRKLLLVLDNFEHLLAAAATVSELLAAAPGLRVIVTSRTPLRVRGEQLFDLEPLAESPAVELLLQCGRAANRRLAGDADTIARLAQICRAVDGLPLAIELAAARLRALPAEQIAAQLAAPLELAARGIEDLPDRQQTLERTIGWSYELLSRPAQAALEAAAVFRGGFTTRAHAAVAGDDSTAALEQLNDASRARADAVSGRHVLLELIRQFAQQRLDASGRARQVRAAHRRHFAVAHAAPASDAFEAGGAATELVSPLRAEHANLRAALEDAIASRDREAAVTLALGLRPLWFASLLRSEAQELIARVLERFQVPAPTEIALLRAATWVEQLTPAESEWSRRLAERAAATGDRAALLTATRARVVKAFNARDRVETAWLKRTLLELMSVETDAKNLGWIHYFLANEAYVNGDYDRAVEHAEHCAAQARSVGHGYMQCYAGATRLLAASARDGTIAQPELADTLAQFRANSVKTGAAYGLWFVARYAAAVAPETAGRWLAHAHRIVDDPDSRMWPEEELRDETLEILGLGDVGPLLADTRSLGAEEALAEAAVWLAGRDPVERAPRKVRGSGHDEN